MLGSSYAGNLQVYRNDLHKVPVKYKQEGKKNQKQEEKP